MKWLLLLVLERLLVHADHAKGKRSGRDRYTTLHL